jgi:hypothetical protein
MAGHYRIPASALFDACAGRPPSSSIAGRLKSLLGSLMLARLTLIAVSLALFGCASVTTADGTRLGLASTEFRAYVERVFREQNRLADALAFALEAPGADNASLAAAETDLLAACAGVNELATARRDGRRLALDAELRAARAVPDCERALRSAATALESHEPARL